jgi:hypothetical protein
VPKADRVRCTPQRTASKTEILECPVLPIALRVGELWDAGAGAEERESETSNNDAADRIYRMRVAVEETVSFVQARSLAGALFQIALAHDAARDLYENSPSEDRFCEQTYKKLNRLLDSVARVLREKSLTDDYLPMKDLIAIYIADDTDRHWSDEIPTLAEEWRRGLKEASTAEV